MLHSWYHSLLTLATYIGVFLFWKWYPSRTGFVLGAIASVSWLTASLVWSKRRRYFVDRVDLCMHAYIIVDLFFEGVLYEVLLCFIDIKMDDQLVLQFHNSNNYIYCTLAFTLLLGGYRAYVLEHLA